MEITKPIKHHTRRVVLMHTDGLNRIIGAQDFGTATDEEIKTLPECKEEQNILLGEHTYRVKFYALTDRFIMFKEIDCGHLPA